MDLEKKYRKEVEEGFSDPPAHLWESIQDDLDIDLVWERISSSLEKQKSGKGIIFKIAASIAILIGLSLWVFLEKGNQEIYLAGEDPVSLSSPQRIPYRNPSSQIKDPSLTLKEGINSKSLAERTVDAPTPSVKTSSEDPLLAVTKKLFSLKAGPLVADNTVREVLDEKGMMHNVYYTRKGASFNIIPDINFTNVTFGFVGQFANTWLVNQKTINGLRSDELTATHASFGNNLGLVAKADLNQKTAVRLEFHLHSKSRQNYHEYLEGNYSSTASELNYINLGMMLARRIGNDNSGHWFYTGIYTAFLNNASERVGNEVQNVNSNYSDLDFGILAGYEYLFPISSNISFGTGAFAKFGLSNAFAGDYQVPSYLNQTRNVSFMVSFSLNYDIK